MARRLQTQHWLWAHRLTLAHYTRDADMTEFLNNEIGDCPHCWRLVAHYAALLATLHTGPAERDATVNSLFGSLEFALDTGDNEVLTLVDPDEEGAA